MARRVLTVERIQEVLRLIKEGLSDRTIARALHLRRSRVREIRELGDEALRAFTFAPEAFDPPWASQVAWPCVLQEIGQGFEIKRVWEERASDATGYPNFWKYLTRRYPALLKETVTLRAFDPGTHCEVDWAGDKILWQDSSCRPKKAHVFVGILCFSQLVFARVFENEQKASWLAAHQRMYAFFGGVPHVTVPDNLKTGTRKAHLYDPDLNPCYAELAAHYHTAIVPARVASPKDKALVENAVGLIMRLFKFRYRHRRFSSISEINEALAAVAQEINDRMHSRLKTSRRLRWETEERELLKPLPEIPFEEIDWKISRVHPDSTIAVEGAFYSVPHLHRGKEVRVKITPRQIEAFFGLERIALHQRDRSRRGARIICLDHLPPQAKAYLETTPQNLLSQARFLSQELHGLIDCLFQEDAMGHLRRAQGLIRHAREEIARYGRQQAEPRINQAISWIKLAGKIKVALFAERLKSLRTIIPPDHRNDIQRRPGNPMLRNSPAERRSAYGTDTAEGTDRGAQALGDGGQPGPIASGGQATGDEHGGGARLAAAGGG
jgi:transposase